MIAMNREVEERALWERYYADRSDENRNAIVVFYQDVIKKTAKRIAVSFRAMDRIDDMIQNGNLELLKVVRTFQYGKYPAVAYIIRRGRRLMVQSALGIDTHRGYHGDGRFEFANRMRRAKDSAMNDIEPVDPEGPHDIVDDEDSIESMLRSVVRPRNRKIISDVMHGRTMKEVGKDHELTESAVSQLIKKELSVLRKRYGVCGTD